MADSNELLATKLESVHKDISEVKASVDKLSDAVVKLALVEERVATSQATLQRAFNAIEKVEARVTVLEKSEPRASAMANRIENAIWALGAVVAIVVLKKTGLV